MHAVSPYSMSQNLDPCDVIVIGSGIGGLSTAALLALAGQRVLVLEQHYTAGGATQTFKRKGYEWDVGLHYMGEVHRPGNALRKIFDTITGGELQWAPMPSIYNHIVIGERIYEYPAGREAFRARMKDYFPKDGAAIDRYLELVFTAARAALAFYSERALPLPFADSVYAARTAGFRPFTERTTLEVLRELTDNAELIAVLTGHHGDYACPPAISAFGIHAQLIYHYIDGGNYPVGGSSRLATTIAAVIHKAGGQVMTSARVAGIMLRDGKAVGVRMHDGRDISAKIVISDAGYLNTATKLLPKEVAASTGMLANVKIIPPARSFVCLYVGLPHTNAALGLDPANIWVHPTADFDANYARYDANPASEPLPMHFINFPSVKDPTWESRYPGKATLEVCSYTNYEFFRRYENQDRKKKGGEYQDLKAKLAEEMWAQVLRFKPQLAGKAEHMEVATPLSFNDFEARQAGDWAGLEHSTKRFQQRWLRPHTPVPGLFLTGQDVTSDGVSGAIMGGVLCTSAILQKDVLGEMLKGAGKSPPSA